MKELKELAWAKLDGAPVNASSVQASEPNLECFVCSDKVVLRKTHLRSRNGIAHEVRAHFMHINNQPSHGTGTACSESAEHMAAKYVRGVTYFDKCHLCSAEYDIHLSGVPHVERRLTELQGNMRPDVTYLTKEGYIGGILEVFHTHATRDSNIAAYTEANYAWCEVNAANILAASLSKMKRIRVIRSALSKPCHKCVLLRKAALEKQAAETVLKSQEVQRARRITDIMDVATLVQRTELIKAQKLYSDADKSVLSKVLEVAAAGEPVSSAVKNVIDDPHGIMYTGKYSGLHIRDIFERDPAYVRWISTTFNGTLIKKRAAEMMESRCHECYEDTDASWKTLCRQCYRNSKPRFLDNLKISEP